MGLTVSGNMAAESGFSSKKRSVRTAVLSGGIGAEREVSLESGRCVAAALKEAGYDVLSADITPNDMAVLEDGSIDVFFIALHGQFGEDGQLQHELDARNLVYTGSGAAASMLAFDKIKAKKAFARAGILTPAHIAFCQGGNTGGLKKKLAAMGNKFVVKPVCQGSSVGVHITGSPDEAVELAQSTSREYGDCIIEEFIAGREITVGVLCGQALPIIEIRPKSQFYDYNAKYVDEGTQFLFDTITDSSLRADIASAAMDCFNALQCRGFGRVDFILADDGRAYALEVNTIPGFTNHSLLPRAAAKTGLTMPMLCAKIVEETLRDSEAQRCGGKGCCCTGIRT